MRICTTCPWRKDSTPGGVDIPGFGSAMARNLTCTTGPEDGFYRIMACHGSKEGADFPCQGYLASDDSRRNLNVRLGMVNGFIQPADVGEVECWRTVDEMIEHCTRETG